MNLNILNSASKIVFILMTIALIALTMMKIVDAKDFIMMCAMAFTYYFSKPRTPSSSITTSTTVTPAPPATTEPIPDGGEK